MKKRHKRFRDEDGIQEVKQDGLDNKGLVKTDREWAHTICKKEKIPQRKLRERAKRGRNHESTERYA